MISNKILRLASCYYRFPIRFGSTLSKESSSSNQNKSTGKNDGGKSNSEYLAADMYDYTTFSYYDIETTMIKYRLPQPSAYEPLKPALQKK